MFVDCGRYVSCRLFPSYHDGSDLTVLIQSHYWLFCTPQKASVGMYSRVDAIISCSCTFDPAIPTSFFNFIQLFLYLLNNFRMRRGVRKFNTRNIFYKRIIKATKYLWFEKKNRASWHSAICSKRHKEGGIVGTKNVDPDLLEAKGWPS